MLRLADVKKAYAMCDCDDDYKDISFVHYPIYIIYKEGDKSFFKVPHRHLDRPDYSRCCEVFYEKDGEFYSSDNLLLQSNFKIE